MGHVKIDLFSIFLFCLLCVSVIGCKNAKDCERMMRGEVLVVRCCGEIGLCWMKDGKMKHMTVTE